ncbi:hypothetical protein MUO32_19630 [Shinella sp. CPCC 101442]|uniref:hypothetical protein n=1 Tax=Shinella sp. CPCC 101442 TaxID=2932265 RepID=UPI002153426B|nr:hypothetical protein [Shinella sp. CPCC 101442]MCR6501249.1 hypothetical protein [Shinella sp. CPCC 101442]
MRFPVAACVVLLSCAVAFASSAPTPGGPGGEAGKPQQKQTETKPAEKVPARTLGVAETFVMPSGNIGCIYIPEGGTAVYQPVDGGPELSCDRIEPKYVRATLGRSGKAVVLSNVGDQGCCGGDRTVDYGETWSAGPFTCYSERTGLTCERSDGHSFLLSRARIRAD